MKIKTKISLTASMFLVLMVGVITSVFSYLVYETAQTEISQFRSKELTRVKIELKSRVDMIAELLESEYKPLTYKQISELSTDKKIDNQSTDKQIDNPSTDKQIDNPSTDKQIDNSSTDKQISEPSTDKQIDETSADTDSVASLKKIIGNLRYNDGEGYFGAYTNELPYPTVIKSFWTESGTLLNSKELDNLAFNKTLHLSTALVQEARYKEHDGFIDYAYQNPKSKSGKPEEKLTYVTLIKNVNWVLASGVYIGNIDKNIAKKQKEIKSELQKILECAIFVALVMVAFCVLFSYFFASKLSSAIEELTKVTEDISLGKRLDAEISSTKRNDEIGKLARSIDRLKTSTKMMISHMDS